LISPISGIVSEIKPVFTDASGLISIYCGVHRVSIANGNFKQLQASLRNNSTGKGKSELQSRVSAFSEAVERYCAVYQGDEFRIRKSYRQMDENFIPLEECMLFSDTQYCKREEWNRANLLLEYVPVRLAPEKSIDWTPVWSFQSQAFKYIPTAYCYLRYNDPSDTEEPFYNVDSNGLAAGNVLEEAILQGFFEVIERDALSIWWYNRLKRPSVDLDSFHNSYFDALREYYLSIGREFWVLDLTTDSTIPTCVAISRKTESEDEALTFGCGTHFDAGIAVSRALTEMNQALYLMESGRIAGHAMSEREQFIKMWNHKGRIKKLPYLAPDPHVIPIKKGSYSQWYKDDLRDDLERCFEITQNMGLELLVHDLTQPDIKLSVVKVIVPGLRQIRARFASGRLYDVPVRQGWVNQAIAESELNPITFWI
jgi:oxazoline/thiazoline synthase